MKNTLQPLVYGLLLAIGLTGGFFISNYTHDGSIISSSSDDKIQEVIRYAFDNYVDSVSREQLVDDAISGMLEKLDPHSVYIPKQEFGDVNDQLNGSFEGIGVQFRIESDTIVVISPVPNGPSATKGILPGDRIVKVDGKTVAGTGIENDDVLKLLKGPKGSKVVLGIYRKGVKGINDYEIIRDVIPLNSLDAAFMLNNSTGYIRLNAFTATTYDEFSKAITQLLNTGMSNLILDLRDNGGGFLNAAVDIADDFLPEGNTIVYTKGLHRKEKFYKSYARGLFEKGKLVILIDEFSASASEILAGSIQDNDRGLIIGRRSFGKGLVQEQIELKDGSAFRLTVARYYTPSGRCIQRPYDGGAEEYYLDFYKSLVLNDSAAWIYNTEKHDSLVYSTRLGRAVYGGGGIFPDSVVLHDYSFTAAFQTAFFGGGKVFGEVFRYIDTERNNLKRNYPDFGQFYSRFQVPSELMGSIYAKSGINESLVGAQDAMLARVFVKANIARELFGIDTYYRVIMPEDNLIKKALQVLR